jgi:hypothetical protein
VSIRGARASISYGTPLVGANHSAYKVQKLDEGSTVTCTVTAANALGISLPATSRSVSIRLPPAAGCPRATGRVSGRTLGLASLGMTRKQARHAYKHSSTRGQRYEDFFCLTPVGVRVGYASPKLVRLVTRRGPERLRGRVVWISTSNPYYAIDGIRPGATLTATEAELHKGNLFHVGINYWYLTPSGTVTAIFKARRGVVEEIGIADKRVTGSRKAQRAFLTSGFA